jgi:hypothetical protein
VCVLQVADEEDEDVEHGRAHDDMWALDITTHKVRESREAGAEGQGVEGEEGGQMRKRGKGGGVEGEERGRGGGVAPALVLHKPPAAPHNIYATTVHGYAPPPTSPTHHSCAVGAREEGGHGPRAAQQLCAGAAPVPRLFVWRLQRQRDQARRGPVQRLPQRPVPV